MSPRFVRSALAALLVAVFGADAVRAQQMESPLQLTSLEWLVAQNDVIVRAVVADVAFDRTWNLVTIDVLENLKGAQAKRLTFVAHSFEAGNAVLTEAKKSKREQVWILKQHSFTGPSEAPDRERTLVRQKTELYAPFVAGRPGEPALPVIPLGPAAAAAKAPPLAFLTIDLRLVKTSDEIVAAMRASIAATPKAEPGQPRQSHPIGLPKQVAERTGFSRAQNQLVMPVDGRLEEFARRLLQTPDKFLPNGDDAELRKFVRLEAVKALRLFPSERNLAIVRDWLDDPTTTASFASAPTVPPAKLVPSAPRDQRTDKKLELPTTLAQVPEIRFQQPLTKAMQTPLAQLHTAVTIDGVHLLNRKKTDAFIETLRSNRPDLAGLSFAMGDACRMKPEAGRNFVAALDVFRKVEATTQRQTPDSNLPATVMEYVSTQSTQKKIDPAASVASLMQVLGHEDGKVRLALVKHLDGLAVPEATRALARLAIFSAEDEVRSAAIVALKKRDAKECTEILKAGLKYPWPAVAERAGEAIVKLGRKDLVPELIDVLDAPDPREPQTQEVDGKKVTAIRELVRLNHHHNCLLCHAPATATREKLSKEDLANVEGLTAQVPVPSESMVAYYAPSVPDILVRFDVTYLRQDFSTKLPVADADPWPEMQRYDFLVRTREVSTEEAREYRQRLQSNPSAPSPYRRAALSALRELTGLDAEGTAAAWRKRTGL
jgi:HEAT repeat protein